MDGQLITKYMTITILNANVTCQRQNTPDMLAEEVQFEDDKQSSTEFGWVQILDVRARTKDGTKVG